jgi:putative FmdB family regulatory protein
VPTYSYACRDCEHRFDIQQAFTDDALTVCPECGGGLRKVFSAVGVVFKGSGFYRNDSRSSSGSTSSPTSTKDSSSSGGSGSGTAGSSGSSSSTSTPSPKGDKASSTSSTKAATGS